MKALQVLYLESVSFSPIGFHSLPNLKTLYCVDCELENFSLSLKNMRSLEILALIGTKIDEISEELVKLSTLKYLRLSGVGVEEEMNIPPNLVSRLTSLQELHVVSKSNINLLELNSLSRLTALSVILSTNQISQEYFVDDCYTYLKAQTLKTVTIANFSSSLTAFNNLFCNVKKLKLRNVSGQKNIVPSIGKTGVNELTSLKLASCKDMEFLIDITSDQGPTVVFSNLVKLNIHNMVSWKGLCYGLSRSHRAIASLTRLRVVRIGSCHQLKTIFSPCVAQSMLYIEKLFIFQCDGVEQVIGFAQEDEIPESCKSLKYVCASTSTQGLQSLEFLHISHCPQFMQIFNMEQNENGQDIVLPGFRSQNYYWPKLKTLRIMDCPIFSCFIVQARLLEGLVISNVGIIWKTYVPVLNEDCIVVENHEEVFQVQGGYSFSRIKELDLKNLFEVRIIWNDFVLSALRVLTVRDCPKLSTSFFIDSQEYVHCKTKTPQSVKQDAIQNPIFSKNINWNWRWVGSQLPYVT
ncbi:hypothetical protein ES288_D05G438500v1 [Gossypium darwinii]|uniref:Disease resistance protein At4g27190-like leucine-rich repeats domain-containing protein n=1 Tax=Gossypium darwinii TaxID=34276 RepID=A0A5D2CTA8_GOSDA|nr:hypothetical protein ES288_D05G438500v1 [Gossypium darwinii]